MSRASSAEFSEAWSPVGKLRITPERKRLMFLLINASGLAFCMATNIWSKENPEI